MSGSPVTHSAVWGEDGGLRAQANLVKRTWVWSILFLWVQFRNTDLKRRTSSDIKKPSTAATPGPRSTSARGGVATPL